MAIGNSVRETERYLDVIERFNPEINAVLTATPEMALEMAHQADKAADDGEWLGLLHGVPMLTKDCLNVAGTRTTFGSECIGTISPIRIPKSSDASGIRVLSSSEKPICPSFATAQRLITFTTVIV